MLHDVKGQGRKQVNLDALKSEIRSALITQKANACPIAMRMAWHGSGTYDKNTCTGGINGATMRFEPESTDPDNAGLHIIRALLEPVKQNNPGLSYADLWAVAAVAAIEFLGGPTVPFNFGRTDDADGRRCPANGRLPDALEGADHLRAVFGRMGFNDQEIVALSGGHTLGRCHSVRSGFDGPWTSKPLRFDNEYFVNLIRLDWVKRDWDGPLQYEDKQTGKLMMLATDIALIQDPIFKKHVETYARDKDQFFRDFARAYGKLISLGCPEECNPFARPQPLPPKLAKSAEFRELAMHGSVLPARALFKEGCDVHELEATSGRSALHKAAFWGHDAMCKFLIEECGLDVSISDNTGDTALHDAARFGNKAVVEILLKAGASAKARNREGQTPSDLAYQSGYTELARLLQSGRL